MMARFSPVMGLVLLAAAPVAAQRPKPVVPVAVAPVAVAPASAPNVRAGVDLWRAGDYPGAVAIWQPFANAGDADAMFNLGQAYKLGRAVPMDKAIARDWYRKAAAKGHLPAQANLGILLFQAGEKPEAARWLKAAADRGEMRAQYVLGVAHWNGDGVAKSLPLAYAYLTRASAQGLTEATGALGNLTRTISPVERANGSVVAASLAAGTGVPAGYAVGAAAPTSTADLNRMNMEAVQRPAPVAVAPVVTRPAVTAPAPVVVASATTTPVPMPLPKPVVTAPAPIPVPLPKPAVVVSTPAPVVVPKPVVPQSVVTIAPAVVAPAVVDRPAAPVVRRVELPASTPVAPAPAAVATVVPKAVVPKPVVVAPVVAKVIDKPKPAEKLKVAEKAKSDLPPEWRVQLGAFGKRAQAEAAWTEVLAKQKAAVGKAKPIYEPGASIIKLQMGPFKTKELAKDACAKIAFGGRACFVTEG